MDDKPEIGCFILILTMQRNFQTILVQRKKKHDIFTHDVLITTLSVRGNSFVHNGKALTDGHGTGDGTHSFLLE